MAIVVAVVIGVVGVLAAGGVVAYIVLADDEGTDTSSGVGGAPSADALPTAPDGPTTPPTPEVDPQEVLERNALYRGGALRSAGCQGSSLVPLDSLENVRAYYESVMPCLRSTWSQIQEASGVRVRPAALQVFSGQASTPCGGGYSYSFYCPSDETIYMYADEIVGPWNQYPTEYSHGITRLAAAHTIAHEFGHHVQHVTGIFEAAGPDTSGTEVERRLELQASCLANVFLASQRDAYPVASTYWEVQNLWRFITAVPNHGSEANQQLWTDRGYQAADPGACNTFTAPSPEVA